jgi:hypothetical protein
MLPSTQASLAILGSLAVWVTGSLSLLGLSISKEQKVSELRQNWIDGLRTELAALLAHSHQIHSYIVFAKTIGPIDLMELWKATREDYLGLNLASTRIKLRLNRAECDSRMILSSMTKMENLFERLNNSLSQKDVMDSLLEIKEIADAIERDAPPLLKKEWERVKKGEPFFTRIRLAALILSFTLLAIFAVIYVTHLIKVICPL